MFKQGTLCSLHGLWPCLSTLCQGLRWCPVCFGSWCAQLIYCTALSCVPLTFSPPLRLRTHSGCFSERGLQRLEHIFCLTFLQIVDFLEYPHGSLLTTWVLKSDTDLEMAPCPLDLSAVALSCFCVCCCLFETESHCIARVGFELVFLPQPQRWLRLCTLHLSNFVDFGFLFANILRLCLDCISSCLLVVPSLFAQKTFPTHSFLFPHWNPCAFSF